MGAFSWIGIKMAGCHLGPACFTAQKISGCVVKRIGGIFATDEMDIGLNPFRFDFGR